jgi:hypothetical protein
VIVKVPVVEPEGTVVVAGTTTAGAPGSAASATTNPAGGAAALIVTVPVIVPPPYAGDGRTDRAVRLIALIVSVAVCELEPIVAVIVAEVFAPDVCVVDTVKFAEVAFAGTTTDAPTVAGAVAASLTVVAVFCAGVMFTVPVDE